jgi:hypothetical protein
MVNNKIVRSVCYFTDTLHASIIERIANIALKLEGRGYEIQTRRICSNGFTAKEIDSAFNDPTLYLSVGRLSRKSAHHQINDFLNAENVAFNLNLSSSVLPEDTDFLFRIIKEQPAKTFNFTYTFHNAPSSPYFPSAAYKENGFAIGLQPTDLSENCESIDEWLQKMKVVWNEINELFQPESDFLGIDSSIAPLFTGKSSLIYFIKKIYNSFSQTVTQDIYLQITDFIKRHNPKPIGLCGVMFPCLEDFELADEYDRGNFSIERNIYLSLHSGLGIDTYPIGIDESPTRVFEILRLLQGLSRKYGKPLSARFISDGAAKIGEKTELKNHYLKDVVVRPL